MSRIRLTADWILRILKVRRSLTLLKEKRMDDIGSAMVYKRVHDAKGTFPNLHIRKSYRVRKFFGWVFSGWRKEWRKVQEVDNE